MKTNTINKKVASNSNNKNANVAAKTTPKRVRPSRAKAKPAQNVALVEVAAPAPQIINARQIATLLNIPPAQASAFLATAEKLGVCQAKESTGKGERRGAPQKNFAIEPRFYEQMLKSAEKVAAEKAEQEVAPVEVPEPILPTEDIEVVIHGEDSLEINNPE